MRRIQFIELHEEPWFPGFLRDEVTDALQYGVNRLRVYGPAAPLIRSLVDSTGARRVVDLCSGGGGPWLELSRTIQLPDGALPVSLTDKYPNLPAFECLRAACGSAIEFRSDSVNAMDVPLDLSGVRTIFTSLHHFPPDEARSLLRNAVAARQAIGVFEITSRRPSALAMMFPWALLAFVFAPFVRPFRWSRLLWTYAVPAVPLVLLFDGIVSCLRSYHPDELLRMARSLGSADYNWEAGRMAGGAGTSITYLIGSPID
jgi:hypothetical protein